MKKFLSLVLALVMAMSLVTVAGAFTDDPDIQELGPDFKEAAEVVSKIGVIEGYSDGSFRPEGELTRQAAAKIICNLILGPTTAKALPTNANPFPDVPAGSEFAGYIAYCAEQNIISGYADGTFKPGDPLSGYAFLKMLLGSLGYDQQIESYVGPNWRVNVAKQAIGIKLDDGLKDSEGNKMNVDGSKVVTRGEAVLYAFNTLQADLIEYDAKTTVTANGATVTVGGDNAKAMLWKNSATKAENIKVDNYVQFAEQYFPDLKLTKTTDDFSRPSSKWTWKGDKIGTFADAADLTYVGNVKLGTIYADLNMTQKDPDAKVYVDGVDVDTVVVEKNSDRKVSDKKADGTKYNKYGTDITVKGENMVDDGVLVEVYYDDSDNKNDVTIIAIDVYAGRVNNVDKKAAAPFVRISALSPMYTKSAAKLNLTGDRNKYEYDEDDEFSEDDIVLYTYSQSANEIKDMWLAESKSGDLSKITSGKSIDLGGETLKYSKNAAFLTDQDYSDNDLVTKSSYVVYLDDNGFVVFVDEEEFKPEDYAFVLAAESASQSGFTKDRVKIVDAKGKVRTLDTDDDYATGTNNLLGQIVTYRADSNGEYTLQAVKNQDNNVGGKAAAAASISVTDAELAANGIAAGGYAVSSNKGKDGLFYMANSNASVYPGGGDRLFANSETVFVIHTFDDTGKSQYDAYTGIVDAPDVGEIGDIGDVQMYWYKRSSNLMGFVFIDAAPDITVRQGSKSVLLLAADEGASKLIRDSSNNYYYEIPAVVNNEITTVRVKSTANLPGVEGTDNSKIDAQNWAFQNPSYDNKNFITKADEVGKSGRYELSENWVEGIWKLSQKYTIGIGVENKNEPISARNCRFYTVASDARIYYVDGSGKITKINVDDIVSDVDDRILAVLDTDSGDLAYLMIQEKNTTSGEGTRKGGTAAGLAKIDDENYTYIYNTGDRPSLTAVRTELLNRLNETWTPSRGDRAENFGTSYEYEIDGVLYTVYLEEQYKITVDTMPTNVSVSTNVSYQREDYDVTVTATTTNGAVVSTLTTSRAVDVYAADGKSIAANDVTDLAPYLNNGKVTFVMPDGPVTISGTKYDSFTVTFDANGGTFAPGTQTTVFNTVAGGKLDSGVTLPTAVNDGKVFKGWALTPDATEALADIADLSHVYEANNTVFAVWAEEPAKYTVTVDEASNVGATVTVDKTEAEAGETVTVTMTVSDGYEDGKVTVEYESGATKEVTGTFEMPAENVTVYAVATPVDYTITTDDSDAGVTSLTADATANVDDEVTATLVLEDGFEVDAITVTTDGGEDVTFEYDDATGEITFTMPADDVTVAATTTAIDYTITTKRSNTSDLAMSVSVTIDSVDSTTANAGDTVDITINADSTAGTFTWSVDTEGGENVASGSAKTGTFTMPAENVVITYGAST